MSIAISLLSWHFEVGMKSAYIILLQFVVLYPCGPISCIKLPLGSNLSFRKRKKKKRDSGTRKEEEGQLRKIHCKSNMEIQSPILQSSKKKNRDS